MKAMGLRIPASSYWESTAAVTKSEASVSMIVWRQGSKWASIVPSLKASLIFEKADLQASSQEKGISFFVNRVRGLASREN
ncbi:hypothetical protein K3495_g16629 [Podosphaera aphanis]|nr:hypothetical protein K3495_g16629 [Podosphaera aphanis]